jgi:ubiquinone/menaquinone biosynthesis C-methylase UbiE
VAWYDVFSNFYDASIEQHYVAYRPLAAEALGLRVGSVVLDCPCGTGQGFDTLRAGIGASGTLIGVDQSDGMLAKARRRIERQGWSNVHLVRHDAASLDRGALAATSAAPIDRLHIFLGMTVFPDMVQTFERLWSLLEPGGRCVIVDVHAPQLGLQGWAVNKIAGADIRRRFWEPLERVLPRAWCGGGWQATSWRTSTSSTRAISPSRSP